MARNQEKAQSMLYRFREAQAIELGVARARTDRRPRLASTVSSLKDCERWRGEILRDISRKVSKIQDAGLTDYEVRDLNDEINKLMREKNHWERQIVALGGANYRRARTGMMDEEGREVPGTRGYKYFGRAKDLPGVKELFNRGTVQESEESARSAAYQKFKHRGPEYYGDVDEMDEALVAEEGEMELKDWAAANARLVELLALSEDAPPVPYPTKPSSSTEISSNTAQVPEESTPTPAPPPPATKGKGKGTKRKAAAQPEAKTGSEDVEMTEGAEAESDKRAKTGETDGDAPASAVPDANAEAMRARMSAFFGVLDVETLTPPKPPTREEMEKILLDVRKKALLSEYGI